MFLFGLIILILSTYSLTFLGTGNLEMGTLANNKDLDEFVCPVKLNF